MGSMSIGASGRLTVTAVDVGITDVVPGTGATKLGKAEDAAAVTGDTLVAIAAVRRDAMASSSTTDGDYSTVNTDASGRVWVTGTVLEDSAHTSGDQGHVIFAVRESTATDLSAGNTNGDYEPLQVDANGRLWVNSTIAAPGATDLTKLEDAAHTSGDAGVMALGVIKATPVALGADGDYSPPILDALNRLWTHQVGERSKFAVVPVVDTNIYAALDIVGGVLTIANWAKSTGGSARLRSLNVWCADGENFEFTIIFFSATPTGGTYADQGAATWHANDIPLFIGKVVVASANYGTFGADGIATVQCDLPLPVAATSLFALIFATATPTFAAATDLNLMLVAEY